MIEVDGSTMEGGGQILRTAVSLSAVTGTPILVHSIRAKRENPGLRPQHLVSVRAAAQICSAQVEGDRVGSDRIIFRPGKPRGGQYFFDVGTAGSVTLVLQTLLPIMVASSQEYTVRVRGGTNVPNSPSADYFEHVFLHHLGAHGLRYTFTIKRRGFYPAGGGEVELHVESSEIRRFELTERGQPLYTFAISGATLDLKGARVAERQLQYVHADQKRVEYVEAPSTGSYILAVKVFSKTRLGCDGVGRRGLRAEEVGRAVWENLERQQGVLDEHMSDQIIPYLVIHGGRAKIKATTHSKTNLYVCTLFPTLPVKVEELGGDDLMVEAA